ncbi:MAG TPA: SIMPL domain-containing protein [Candidatus Kapabacteria bacterium]|nr:SIMPL domain-containing protein [Candidatus Kapabacteria bacterium]
MYRVLSTLLVLLGLSVAVSVTLSAQSRTETIEAPTIRVTGSATSSANPDLLQMQIAVVTRDSSARSASEQNARVVANVLAALRSNLGAGSSIVTVRYTIEPQYVYSENGGEPRFAGFIAHNAMLVETSDLTKAGELIDAAVNSGANNVTEILYTLRNQTKLKSDALAGAAREARAKAESLAAATGVRLGAVRTIDETVRFSPMSYAVANAERDGAATQILSGPVEVNAMVTIVYDIVR